jgi:hypothetical protein
MGRDAQVGRTILVHHRSQNHEAVMAAAQGSDSVQVGRPGLVVELDGIAHSTEPAAPDSGDDDEEPPATKGETSASIAAAS